MTDRVEDKHLWTFSIEWTERIPYPDHEQPYRTISKGELLHFDNEVKAYEQQQWHLNNMGSWTPDVAIDAFVSGVTRRIIGTKVVSS